MEIKSNNVPSAAFSFVTVVSFPVFLLCIMIDGWQGVLSVWNIHLVELLVVVKYA